MRDFQLVKESSPLKLLKYFKDITFRELMVKWKMFQIFEGRVYLTQTCQRILYEIFQCEL